MKGRSIHVPRSTGRIARFSFSDLCERPLGASDFLAIAARFDTVFIDHIPFSTRIGRNETKRFIILIDALYDHTVRVIASAAAMPEELLVTRKVPKVSNSTELRRDFLKCAVPTTSRSTTKNVKQHDRKRVLKFLRSRKKFLI